MLAAFPHSSSLKICISRGFSIPLCCLAVLFFSAFRSFFLEEKVTLIIALLIHFSDFQFLSFELGL